MKILVIGSGGREHALVWKISQSKLVKKIFCAPGNGGIAQLAECIDIGADDVARLLEFARKERIDLTVVGPEAALALGIVDEFKKYGLKIFGPDKKCSQLEASKVFAKEMMARFKIPTAAFKVFDDPVAAKKYIDEHGAPCVVKADGLAQGKGVIVAKTVEEAKEAVAAMLEKDAFGLAGRKIIVEDCLEGEEASFLIVTDADVVEPLASSQDHKRIFDYDQGPNTGGMGAYSPAPIVNEKLEKQILEQIVNPFISGLNQSGMRYSGILYVGIMITKEGPKVLEFNVRFGDPETQAILPRLKSDIVEIMLAVVNGKLAKFGRLTWDERVCVCVVCSAGGYPGEYQKGKEIFGLDEAAKLKDVVVFHAGTKIQRINDLGQRQEIECLTHGGRVLGVTGLGKNIKEAINTAYNAVEKINFEGMHYRKDIGAKAIREGK